ncbi:MAG TPA: zf-HC2 domain-containing protein, partial [Mycobacteriales bacterium]|nr:zf-HC2 domain-containing protein [Mycobacteriales bacterium]
MSHLDDWAAALVDAELGPDERDRALAHLAGCDACRADVDTQRRAKALLTPAEPAAPLPAALTARLLAIPAGPASADPSSDVVRRSSLGRRRPAGSRPWRARAGRPVPARRRPRRVAARSFGACAAALTVAVRAGGQGGD